MLQWGEDEDDGDDGGGPDLLEDVGALVVVDHGEEELVGEGRGVAPGVGQDLVLLVGLPVEESPSIKGPVWNIWPDS